MSGDHIVTFGDFRHYMDPENEWFMAGFASPEAAQEYARRFIRASIEELRGVTAPSELGVAYARLGDYAATAGFDSAAWITYCVANPATRPEETDHAALRPAPGGR